MQRLPIGYDSFEEIRREGLYYVDKTGFIPEFLKNFGKVTLFTRPRRFGKTLMMDTLKSFFGIGSDPALFDGLAVSRETKLCREHQGKYPVIFISLKEIDGLDFQEAMARTAILFSNICKEFSFLTGSEKVDEDDRKNFSRVKKGAAEKSELSSFLVLLMRMLHAHFGRQVVLLIDEYDVPLDKAFYNGYYREMIGFIQGLFGGALKTNRDLMFAVLIGCLRISKESIFTGINNLRVDMVSDDKFAGYFGFTEKEVEGILKDYGAENKLSAAKEWYDGYCFGEEEMYCPWDVLCYMDLIRDYPDAEPKLFWINSSSNSIIKDLIAMADDGIKEMIEDLFRGESIEVHVEENLTYDELREDPANVWSMMYLTGYLTRERGDGSGLVIPNKEVREIFITQVQEWVRKSLCLPKKEDAAEYLFGGQQEALQKLLNTVLMDTISYFDYREDFYHAFLAGLLTSTGYPTRSNRESGLGRSDIVVKSARRKAAVIIEVKHSFSQAALKSDCEKALKQVREKRYAEPFEKKGYKVLRYGISFFEKECRVELEE